MHRLAVLETHPVQYHSPVYRCLAAEFSVEVHAVYGGDFSVAGYRDAEFGASFAWDTDLLGGVNNHFLSRVQDDGASNYESVTATGLGDALERIKPNAIMALGYAHPFDRDAIKWARQHATPLLFRGETSDHAHRRTWWRRLVRDFVLRRLYQRCSALLYVGKRSRAHYERLGVPDSRLFFSPYCVDSSTFRCSDADRSMLRTPTREQWGIAEDAIVVLFSGKLSHRKGVDLLPEAVRLLPSNRRERVHLVFLGDGTLKESLATACAIEPALKVTFTGFQNQSNLSALYHAADVLVLPSREKETWGLVVNEAMMHGLPCVVSDAVGSQPDLVLPGSTGACFAGEDPAALAEALDQVLNLLGKSTVAATCRETVGRYSVTAAAGGVARALEALTISIGKTA